MHSGRNYTFREFIYWTRRHIYVLILLATIPTVLYAVAGLKWLAIPWVPVALIGTASAFIAGFRNNATYARAWEARQIWGGIVNSSRSFGIMVKDFIGISDEKSKALHQNLIYRHIAWLTALRFQLREPRTWENIKSRSYNAEYSRHYHVDEWINNLEDELRPYLTEEERVAILNKKNKATQLIALQSSSLKALTENGALSELKHIELENLLKELYEHQGKAERIKNYPYPRQYASINTFFIWLFIIMVPFGMLKEFEKIGDYAIWLNIPFSVIVCWVFTTLEQVGESTENPFEGGANDVPITAMSRTIEIDLREMLGETELPPALQPENKILL